MQLVVNIVTPTGTDTPIAVIAFPVDGYFEGRDTEEELRLILEASNLLQMWFADENRLVLPPEDFELLQEQVNKDFDALTNGRRAWKSKDN